MATTNRTDEDSVSGTYEVPAPSAAPAAPPAAPPVAPRASVPDRYPNEGLWRQVFRDGHRAVHAYRRLAAWLPSPPRCNVCRVPFAGPGGRVLRWLGRAPSHRNSRYCNQCDRVIRSRAGATDLELTIVFADVRGSTSLAEHAEDAGARAAYVQRLRHFAETVKAVLERTDGFLIDVVGDEVVGVYPPGLSGPRHALCGLQAARELARLGAAGADDPDGLSFGVAVHTGEVFLGNRFSAAEHPAEDELSKVRIMGDHVNVAARLASVAAAGEALVSDAAMAAAGITLPNLEHRSISVKGRHHPIGVRVLTAA